MPEPAIDQSDHSEQAIDCTIISTKDEAKAAAAQAYTEQKRVLFYALQDGQSYLVVWLPNSIGVGQGGRGDWEEHRFFPPEQEAEARTLTEVLRALLPLENVNLYQTKRLFWAVSGKVSLYWQSLQEIHPRYNPHPTPYSRVLTPDNVLQLPLWYDEARRTGYQTLVFKVGSRYQVVHIPKDLDLGDPGERPWDTRIFFEESIKAEHFAQCLRLVEGIEDAVVTTHRSSGVPRRWLWVVTVTAANA